MNNEETSRAEARQSASGLKDKSEDDFEKNLVLITSGTLVLSMTFIEKIAPLDKASSIWFLITAWTLLTLSLLGNLLSHMLSGKYARDTMQMVDDYTKDVLTINKEIRSKNRTLIKLNNWTVSLMISGIISLVVYCSINAHRMSNLGGEKNIDRIEKPYIPDTNKGRTISPIQMPKPMPQPSTQTTKHDTGKR